MPPFCPSSWPVLPKSPCFPSPSAPCRPFSGAPRPAHRLSPQKPNPPIRTLPTSTPPPPHPYAAPNGPSVSPLPRASRDALAQEALPAGPGMCRAPRGHGDRLCSTTRQLPHYHLPVTSAPNALTHSPFRSWGKAVPVKASVPIGLLLISRRLALSETGRVCPSCFRLALEKDGCHRAYQGAIGARRIHVCCGQVGSPQDNTQESEN